MFFKACDICNPVWAVLKNEINAVKYRRNDELSEKNLFYCIDMLLQHANRGRKLLLSSILILRPVSWNCRFSGLWIPNIIRTMEAWKINRWNTKQCCVGPFIHDVIRQQVRCRVFCDQAWDSFSYIRSFFFWYFKSMSEKMKYKISTTKYKTFF